MSMFRYGTFATYTDTSLGRITYRPQYAQSFTLTPAIDLYPTILPGQGTGVCSTERIKAGESVTLPAVGGGNTNIYIPASDYIRDIGDLRTLAVDSAAGSMSVAGKRLQRLKLGDPDASTVTSTLTGLTIGACPSLTEIDARNVTGLTETIDLTNCPRIKSAYFGGTDVKSVIVPSGAKITNLQLSDATTTISLVDLPKLSSEGLTYRELSNVEYLRIEDCPNLDAFGMLKELYNTESKSLRNIRVTDFVYDGNATDVDMVMNLAKDIAADGSTVDYTGIDSEGTPQQTLVPIIEGTLNIAGSVYEDSTEFVREQYPNLILNIAGGYYIRFADKAVQDICVAKWGDGTGITKAQAAAVTSIGTVFRCNTIITTFDEFSKFTNITEFPGSYQGAMEAFSKCTALRTITLPPSFTKIGDGNARYGAGYCAFNECTSLENVNVPTTLYYIGNCAFLNCTSLSRIDLSNITYIGQDAFGGCSKLNDLVNTSKVETLGSSAFSYCKSLQRISLPSLTSDLSTNTFLYCTALERIDSLGTTPKTIARGQNGSYGNFGFAYGCTSLTYVDLSCITSIGAYAFSKCTSLTNINLSSTLTTIDEYAFYNCTPLSGITLPPSLTTIGNNAFNGCTSLEIADLSLPNLETLGVGAFSGVKITKISNLGKITSLQNISRDSTIFGDKTTLVSVNLPSTLTSIGNYVFDEYSALESINLPLSLTNIGNYTFNGCSALTTINLPASLTTIGSFAFSNCTSIVRFIDLPNLETLGQDAFSISDSKTGSLAGIENLGKITAINNASNGS